MDSLTEKAIAFEIAKRIDTDTFEGFKQKGSGPGLENAVEGIISTNVPGWLIYYITEEYQNISAFPEKLVALVDDEHIQSTAERYLEADNPIIELANPISQNWMSENPERPFREELERRRQRATAEVYHAIKRGFPGFDEFADKDFIDWLASGIIQNTDMLQWEILRRDAENNGSEYPDRRVAEGLISGIHLTSLAITIDSYFSEGEDGFGNLNEYNDRLYKHDERDSLQSYEPDIGVSLPRIERE